MKLFYGCIVLMGLLLPAKQVMAQQRPKPSLFMINHAFFNPAINGIEDYAYLQAGLRRQWIGTDGAPATNWLNASMPLRKRGSAIVSTDTEFGRPSVADNGHGLGISFYQDNIGPYANTNLNIGYAYHLPLTGTVSMSAGFSAGLNHYKYDAFKNLYVDEANDPSAAAQSSAIQSNKTAPDLNIGMMVYGKSFFAGVSAMRLIKSKIVELPNSDATTKTEFNFSSGYTMPLNSRGLRLWLSALLSADFSAPAGIQLSTKLDYQNLVWLGVIYRKGENMGVNAGLNISKEWMMAYVYEWGMNNIYNPYGKTSHEATLVYRFLKAGQSNVAKIGW